MVALELRHRLALAYPRCTGFDGACTGMRFDPANGLFPRGYAGATGTLADVALVICVAEPGEPASNARVQPNGAEPADVVEALAAGIGETFRNGQSAFHSNVRRVMNYCWPGVSVDEQFRRTWITEGVLCSAAETTGPVPRSVEHECASRYLIPQLDLLPKAFVIALGGKARRRLRRAGREPNQAVHAAGLPGCNQRAAIPSWERAGLAFQQHFASGEA